MSLAIPRKSIQAALHAIDLVSSNKKMLIRDAIGIAAESFGRKKKEISLLVRKGRKYLTELLSGQEPTDSTAEKSVSVSSLESPKERRERIKRIQMEGFGIPDDAVDIGIERENMK